MIREFSAKATASNQKARILFISSTVMAFAFVAVASLIDNYRGIISLFGVLLMSVAIVIYNKYVSSVYYYDITFDSEGTPLFVVRQIVGKRQSTICRIALYEIQKISRETSKERVAHKTPYEYRKYSYLPTLSPSVSYRLITSSRYEKAEILIEVSDEFASLLSEYISTAKEMREE